MKVTQEAVDLYAFPPAGLKLPGQNVSRDAEIIRRRAQGDVMRVIGEDFGISRGYVDLICRRAMRLVDEYRDGVPVTHGLSFRSRRALGHHGIFKPEHLGGMTVEELSMTPNIGRSSVNEIVTWAQRNGIGLTGDGKQAAFAPH